MWSHPNDRFSSGQRLWIGWKVRVFMKAASAACYATIQWPSIARYCSVRYRFNWTGSMTGTADKRHSAEAEQHKNKNHKHYVLILLFNCEMRIYLYLQINRILPFQLIIINQCFTKHVYTQVLCGCTYLDNVDRCSWLFGQCRTLRPPSEMKKHIYQYKLTQAPGSEAINSY